MTNKKTIPFLKDDVLFYIENEQYIIAVLDRVEDLLFGVQVYPEMGHYWVSTTDEVEDAYKKKIVDFTQDCDLI